MMLRYSLIHPMPNGDTFHISSHKMLGNTLYKLYKVKLSSTRHPEKFEKWFDYRKIYIRDNLAAGKIVFKVNDKSDPLTSSWRK